jgi:hypothetical protein
MQQFWIVGRNQRLWQSQNKHRPVLNKPRIILLQLGKFIEESSLEE